MSHQQRSYRSLAKTVVSIIIFTIYIGGWWENVNRKCKEILQIGSLIDNSVRMKDNVGD